MLTEAVFDGSQAMRDPVGGSVEFHFVPILKLISTLLIMGIFNNEDVKHILKMIDPSVFGKKEEAEEPAEEAAPKEEGEEVKEKEEAAEGEEEAVDEGVGEEEEEELKELKKEEREEGEEFEKAVEEEEGEKVDGEKAEEEKEAEEVGEEAKEEDEEAPEEGLLQMKMPESVKLQVSICPSIFLHCNAMKLVK